MAYTLLNGTNKVLARVGVIQGVAGNLTTLTDSGRQIDIDVAVMMWSEVLQDFAQQTDAVPGLMDSGTITLANGAKEYAPPTGTVSGKTIELVKWITLPVRRLPLYEYPGGFTKMTFDQPDPTIFQGLPVNWVISAITGWIRFDFTPTANEAGVTGTVFGVPRVALTLAGDLFPVSDTVVDQLVPAVAMKWSKERKKGDFDREEYYQALSDAMRWAQKATPQSKWGVGSRSWR